MLVVALFGWGWNRLDPLSSRLVLWRMVSIQFAKGAVESYALTSTENCEDAKVVSLCLQHNPVLSYSLRTYSRTIDSLFVADYSHIYHSVQNQNKQWRQPLRYDLFNILFKLWLEWCWALAWRTSTEKSFGLQWRERLNMHKTGRMETNQWREMKKRSFIFLFLGAWY